MTVGVLALQGAVQPHIEMFTRLGSSCKAVKSPKDLELVDRLLMPGGESTTMLKLLDTTGLGAAIVDFAKSHPIWGICAGAILIASEVANPKQTSLGLIDIKAYRNHYGSQQESFTANIEVEFLNSPIAVDFIRAPLLEPTSKSVEVLALHEEQAVLLQQRNIVVSSFHSELGLDGRLHQWFLNLDQPLV